jgi:hypothetical protein
MRNFFSFALRSIPRTVTRARYFRELSTRKAGAVLSMSRRPSCLRRVQQSPNHHRAPQSAVLGALLASAGRWPSEWHQASEFAWVLHVSCDSQTVEYPQALDATEFTCHRKGGSRPISQASAFAQDDTENDRCVEVYPQREPRSIRRASSELILSLAEVTRTLRTEAKVQLAATTSRPSAS